MAFQQNHKEAEPTVSGYASCLTPKQPLRSGRPSIMLSKCAQRTFPAAPAERL